MANHGHRGWSKFEIAAWIAFILSILAFIWFFLPCAMMLLRRLYEFYV